MPCCAAQYAPGRRAPVTPMSVAGKPRSAGPDKRARSGPTIEDVARKAQVSTATVSRCLNDPDLVIPATRERVMAAVDALGYAPNFSARTLAANKSGTIGAIIPTMENAIFARGLQAFQEELGAFGYTLLVASSAYQQDVEAQQIRKLIARGVDALMLIGHDRDEGAKRFLAKSGLPFVNAWIYSETETVSSVGFDNRAAMRALTEKVLDFGHRHVAIISAPRDQNDRARERYVGAMEALGARGIVPADVPVIDVNYSIRSGAQAFTTLMRARQRPTAVMCGNDVLAIGALNGARQLGLNVPGDVSITGFDDIELAQVSNPELTTVHVPHREMGKRAARLLVDQLDSQAQRTVIKLETQIVMRQTLGPAPG